MKKFFHSIVFVAILLSLFSVTVFADEYFVINTETGKYHRTSCSYLPAPSKRDRLDIEEIESYDNISPCKHCKPLDHIYDEEDAYYDDSEPIEDDEDKLSKFLWTIIPIVLFAAGYYLEKRLREFNPYKPRGLKGLSENYYWHVVGRSKFLPEETRTNVLKSAYDSLITLQKAYASGERSLILSTMYEYPHKESSHFDVFAICFLLKHKTYPYEDAARKASIVFYEELEATLVDMYEYSISTNTIFPMEIVNHYYSKGCMILDEQSKQKNLTVEVQGKKYFPKGVKEIFDFEIIDAAENAGARDGDVFRYDNATYLKNDGKYYSVESLDPQ